MKFKYKYGTSIQLHNNDHFFSITSSKTPDNMAQISYHLFKYVIFSSLNSTYCDKIRTIRVHNFLFKSSTFYPNACGNKCLTSKLQQHIYFAKQILNKIFYCDHNFLNITLIVAEIPEKKPFSHLFTQQKQHYSATLTNRSIHYFCVNLRITAVATSITLQLLTASKVLPKKIKFVPHTTNF